MRNNNNNDEVNYVVYGERGKIRWAKLSRFSRVPRKFFRVPLFNYTD